MRKTTQRLAVAALSLGLAAAGMAPALADPDGAVTDDDSWFDDTLAGDGGGLLGSGGGLLGGLLGGDGGLLGPAGLLGGAGGLLPSLLGGHSSFPEFADGTGDLVDGLSTLPGALAGAPPVGGEHTGENSRIAGGVLSGILDLGSILGGLTGRL